MSNKQTTGAASVQKKGGKQALIICIFVIIALVGVIAYLVFGNAEPKRNVVVNSENIEEVIKELEEETEQYTGPLYYEAKMNSEWFFSDGASASENAYVENVTTNTHDVYFDVIRTDTNETIYESPVLPIGSHLEYITLDSDLDAGTYDCVLVYHLIDERQNSLTTASFSLKIVVEN